MYETVTDDVDGALKVTLNSAYVPFPLGSFEPAPSPSTWATSPTETIGVAEANAYDVALKTLGVELVLLPALIVSTPDDGSVAGAVYVIWIWPLLSVLKALGKLVSTVPPTFAEPAGEAVDTKPR
jgi:hypothetical protein